MNVRSRLLSICLSRATQFAGPSNTWMASLPDLATVATVGLNTTTQPPSAPSDLYLSCIQTRRRAIQLFSRRPHQLTNQRNPSRRRRHKWSRRRRMRPRPPAPFLHRYCWRRLYQLWSWRAEWNSPFTRTR